MSPTQLAVFASRAFGVPLLDLATFDLDQIQKELVDAKIAQARRVLPLHRRGNRLFVATSDPANLQGLEEVRFKTNLVVEPVVVEDDKLAGAIHKLVEASGALLKDIASMDDLEVDLQEGGQPAGRRRGELGGRGRAGRQVHPEDPARRDHAGVSDIHFEPYEKFYRVRYRLDGVLMEIAQPPLVIKDKVASRIKVISKLDISEKRVPQDGRMKIVLSKSKAIDFRVSTLPTLFGEKIVMRILDASGIKLGIEALGYEPDQQEALLARHRAAVRNDPRHRPDRQRQDGVAVHLPQHPEPARRQHLDRRGPGGNPARRRQPGQRQREGGAHVRRPRCARSCGRTRTSSWSAKSATSRPPTSRSRRRRRATWSCRRCTPTTRRRRSCACSTWASRRSTSRRRSS